jgi:hypothetical protein
MDLETKYIHIDNETIDFLKSRPWYSSNKEHYELINDKLNEYYPHTHVVAPLISHIDITKNNFANCVFFDSNIFPIKIQKMKDSECHNNCDKLFKKKIIKKIFTGYALSNDGRWRFHSWCIDIDNILIETTEYRIAYYGVEVATKRLEWSKL